VDLVPSSLSLETTMFGAEESACAIRRDPIWKNLVCHGTTCFVKERNDQFATRRVAFEINIPFPG
jgi:hypothetical protein